jgi:hypothetical protein
VTSLPSDVRRGERARLFIDTNQVAFPEQGHPVVMGYDRTHLLFMAANLALVGLAICVVLFAM